MPTWASERVRRRSHEGGGEARCEGFGPRWALCPGSLVVKEPARAEAGATAAIYYGPHYAARSKFLLQSPHQKELFGPEEWLDKARHAPGAGKERRQLGHERRVARSL